MWILLALGASAMWGLSYTLNGQVFKRISPISSLALGTVVTAIFMVVAAIVTGALKRDFTIVLSSKKLIAMLVIQTVALILAELFICYSIAGKSAVLAGLIEISYPIFIALFTYLIFKEGIANVGTLVGGALIFVGVAVVSYFNR
jgi:drug/metabolite transporter (DMT)-like permease